MPAQLRRAIIMRVTDVIPAPPPNDVDANGQ
jgi:hypothetical protein